ncbi:LamG domain-containing protein [Thalassotalea sp. M1531]|uniref:LamG domain-containing protein n=1 Tax=Thalassotalea algicola TaxID=2716224 RepID=A0A7Y0Q7J0_9GAMM|nr:LamG domain-containing protein [Thalassotalea algicola]NMP31937.1 LamG domain-containing protein [Thalassotalea algicola]
MRMIQVLCLLIFTSFSPWIYAACSAFAGRAVINEVYTGTFESHFIELKVLDNTIDDSDYDSWNLRLCSDSGCDNYDIDDFTNYYPWLYLETADFNSSRVDFKDGFDVHLTDGSGDTINYISVEGFDDQDPGSCSAYDEEVNTGASTRLIKREPDGTGSFDVHNNGQSQDEVTQGDDNVNPTPAPPVGFSCDAADSFDVIAQDDFGTNSGRWSVENFDRNVLNWPGQSIYNSPSETQVVDFDITGGQMEINGGVTSGGDNEYGAVVYDFGSDYITTEPNQYSIIGKITTNYGNDTNNDVGIVFGYVDDENYYLARWTKFGAIYSNDSNFPGTYRQLDLIKVAGGVATTLDTLTRADSIVESHAADDGTGSSNDGNISMKVVVTDEGTGVCVGKADRSAMTLQLFSTESPELNRTGFYSYDNDIGLEIDDFEVRCDDCEAEVSAAFYEFEDADQDFSDGVEDSNGILDGINFGGSSTADGKYCRAFVSDANSSSATSNAFETGVTLTNGFTKGTVSFWYNSNTAWNTGAERTLWDASNYLWIFDSVNKHFVLKINSSGQLVFSVEDNGFFFIFDNDYVITETPAAGRVADTWYYVTSTWDYDSGDLQLFVDGNLVASNNFGAGLIFPSGLGKVVIGDNSSANVGSGNYPSANSANGKFDNVKVYNKVLSQAEITADMDGVSCATDPTYVIEHDGNGITCLPEPVTIRACLDASCTTVDTSINTQISLLVNGGASQTVDIVNGIANPIPSVNYTDTVNNAILSSGADFVCRNTSIIGSLGQTDADCGVNFANAGFVFNTINNQVAGEDFNQAVTVQAVQADENGACSALFNNTTTVGFAMQYQAPTTATVNEYTIGGTSISKVVGQPAAGDFVDIDVPFNASGIGTLPTNIYYDAGQITLHAYKVIPATPDLDAVTLTGNSNNFWVQPDRFEITSTLAGALGTYPAGEDFSYQITAVNEQGATTTNYRDTHGNVQASIVRVAPTSSDATNGTFTFADSLGIRVVDASETFIDRGFDFGSNGVAEITTAEYSEVGVISLDVQDNNYGLAGLLVEATAVNLGRFIPKYFEQSVPEDGNISGTCGPWAYSGQLMDVGGNGAISYGTEPRLSIIARNAHNAITRNYRDFGVGDNFAPLVQGDIVITPPTEDLNQDGALGTKMLLTSDISHAVDALEPKQIGGNDVGGEFIYSFNSTDHFVYTRDLNAVFTPFNAEFDIEVTSITDSDGVVATTLEDVNIRSNVEIRFGRLVLANSYGPETSDLPQPFTTEYLTNAVSKTFIANVDDSCTAISDDAGDWDITNGDTSNGLFASDISLQGGAGVMTSGEFNGVELRSDDSEQGSVGVEYTTPPWLQYDWNNDGVYDDNASAIATFGRFRGNDRIIYWKEVNN